jgi:hypothetical protein
LSRSAAIFSATSNCFQNTVVFSNCSTRPLTDSLRYWALGAKSVDRRHGLASKALPITLKAEWGPHRSVQSEFYDASNSTKLLLSEDPGKRADRRSGESSDDTVYFRLKRFKPIESYVQFVTSKRWKQPERAHSRVTGKPEVSELLPVCRPHGSWPDQSMQARLPVPI